ncbi:hypothetical protein P4B35_12560 [Pontiellaceae bacterium B12227]|nr:hypothetical protein [Pontiellaceae bacterium B12227]
MKKLALMLLLALTAGAAHAETIVFEEDFSSYTGGTIFGDDWRPKFDTNTAPPYLQQDLLTSDGTYAVLDTSKAIQNYHAPTTHGFSLAGDDEFIIKTDMRFVHASGGAPDIKNKSFFSLNIGTTTNWFNGTKKDKAVVMRNKAIGLAHDGTDGLWVEGWVNVSDLGVNADTGGTSDWVIVQSDLSVSNGTVWMDMDVYNSETFVVLVDGTPRDTGIAEGTTIYAGVTSGYNGSNSNTVEEITQVSEVHFDNFYVGTPPLETIIWQDDFNDLADEASVQYREGWNLINNNNKWAGYNGYAMQRPNFSTNKTGGTWGGVMSENAMEPQVGETATIEFDWRAFTAEANNNAYLDIAMMGEVWTNGVWDDRPQAYYDSSNTAMGFRLYQKSGGGWRLYYAETTNVVTVADFDDSVIGVDPDLGVHTGDTVRVTYSIERSTKDDVLFVGLSLLNQNSGAAFNAEVKVDNADLYSQASFYAMFAAFNNFAVGTEGSEYDNFVGTIRALDPDDMLPEGVIIVEDFNDMADGANLDADRDWDVLNGGQHFVADNGVATCWPSEGLGLNWRGEMNTFSSITDVEVGDTIEIAFDEKIYGRNVDNSTMLDVILSSVYTNAGTSYDNDNAVGIRVAKKATGDYRIDTYAGSPGADDFSTSFTNLGAVAVDGSTTTEWHRVTYSLEKSATADTWIVDLTVSNMVSGWSDSLVGVDVVASNTYNASELFFGFYGASNYGNTNGISIDNLLVKHIVPDLVGYELWAEGYDLSGGENGDDDFDGLLNWGEWMLDGNPKDGSDLGESASIDGMEVSILLRQDGTGRYALVSTENLVTGPWTTGTWVNITGSTEAVPPMEQVSIPAEDAAQKFNKVIVEKYQ